MMYNIVSLMTVVRWIRVLSTLEYSKFLKVMIVALSFALIFSTIGNFALANVKSYAFSATISPDKVNIDQTILYIVNITNTGNSTLGSTTISIPTGFTVSPDVSILTPSGWNFILDSDSINLTSSNGAATIDQGENLIFSFSSVTSSTIGITTWTANAWSGMGWSGTSLALEGAQPTVTVNSFLTQPTASPTPNTVDQGQTSLISQVVSASGGTLPYTYQWLESFDASIYSPIAGANQPSYTFATTTSTAIGTWGFELRVTDSSSIPLTTTSDPVFVVVNSALAAPSVTAVPNTLLQSQTSDLSSSSIITGTAPFSFQWYQKAPGSTYTIVGDNSPSYTFPGSTTVGTWTFLLEVTDSAAASVNSSEVLPVFENNARRKILDAKETLELAKKLKAEDL